MLNLSPYIGQRIADRREKLKLSHAELAERASLTEVYIKALEKGKREPDVFRLSRAAAALEVSIDELYRHARYLWHQ